MSSPLPPLPAPGSYPIIVVGMSAMGLRLIERLQAAQVPCLALATADEAANRGPEFDLLHVPVLRGAPPWAIELAQLPLAEYGAFVAAGDDQSDNVDTLLAARRLAPTLPLLVRLDDAQLRAFVAHSVPGAEPFSSAVAATPVALELVERLMAAQGERMRVIRRPLAAVRGMLPRPGALFWSVFAGFLMGLLPTAAYFARELGLTYLDAFYFVWVTALSVGYGDIHLRDASPAAKLIGMAVMLFGAGFTAAMAGLLADWLLTRRLGGLILRVAVAMRGHVVIFGAGTVGTAVATELQRRRVAVVVVEREQSSHGVAQLRAIGVPVVVGDAEAEESLRLASVRSACVVLALTQRDATNLHLALRLGALRSPVPCVVRLQSEEISRHVEASGDFPSISTLSVTVAAAAKRVEALRDARRHALPAPATEVGG